MPAANQLFGRVIQVITGIQGQPGFKVLAEPLIVTDIPALRVDFNVKYTTDGKPSKATAVIYNPPDQMIADLLEGENAFLGISAGYVGRYGDIFSGIPVRDGTDVEKASGGDVKLTIAALSGGPRYRTALAQISLAGRQQAKDIAEKLVIDAGWTMGRNDIDPAIVYPRGYVSTGNAAENILAVARYSKTEFTIIGDEVSFLGISSDAGANQQEVTKFSSKPDLGNLIGNVSRTDKGLKFRGLLEPGIYPGSLVSLEHYDLRKRDWVNERVILREVTYVGSNYGSDFFVECSGKAIK